MKTPFQGETRGVMMSGDSPQPNAVGDHIFEMETVITGQPSDEKTMSDKAVQMSPFELSCEPIGNSSRISPNALAHQDGPSFDSGERRSLGLEDISSAEDFSSACPTSEEPVPKAECAMRSEGIQAAPDNTDGLPAPKVPASHQQEEDSCLVNCLFYLDECCTCTII